MIWTPHKTTAYRISSAIAIIVLTFANAAHSTDTPKLVFKPGSYAVKSELIMPHLKENLRYATTQSKQCLEKIDAFGVFPILSEESFVGCVFIQQNSEPTVQLYNLVCENPTAATGVARIVLNPADFFATLDVKMGGKNMKFSQHVSGRRIGACI